MRFLPILAITSSILSLVCYPGIGVAQEAPKPQYSLKEEEPRLGTNIRKNQLTGPRIALNLPYAQLAPEEKDSLRSWWEGIPDSDEPPFPAEGLRALYDPLRKAHNALSDPGNLFAVATVGPDGKVIEAKVFEAPSKTMATFAAKLLLLTTFKPALCSGQPCRMDFPLRMTFTTSR